MKSAFVAGILLGITATLGAARFYPWVNHPRSVSVTTVLHNGGRVEDFLIRFPVDRISTAGTAQMGLRARSFPSDVELPEEFTANPVLVEHFKLRNIDGDVIGVAARHTNIANAEATAVWALTIPSRGTLRLRGAADPGALDRALAAEGRREGQAWSGELELAFGSVEAESGLVAGGSHEFAGLIGTYSENWLISGVSQAGELRGTIKLHTTAEAGG
jgi:hypothetical protein